MKICIFIETYVEKYLCKNIKEYIKNRKYKNIYNVYKMYIEKYDSFLMF